MDTFKKFFSYLKPGINPFLASLFIYAIVVAAALKMRP